MSMQEIKLNVENWLSLYFFKKGTHHKLLYEAMSYSIGIGGKRVRPILLIMGYNLFKDDFEKVLPIAGAIEMIHTYSLIHDDLPAMDNDDLRRGMPTNHKVFGEAVAILAGDGLLNESANILLNHIENNNDIETIKACSYIMKASGADGMIGGQLVDIISENKEIDKEVLYFMHGKKTGALIKASIVAGAMLGGADQEEIEALEVYGEKLGLAFQIIDDILDVTGSEDKIGKPVKSDIENNKTTFVSTYGVEKCIEISEQLTRDCVKILQDIKRDTEDIEKLTLYLLQRQE